MFVMCALNYAKWLIKFKAVRDLLCLSIQEVDFLQPSVRLYSLWASKIWVK